MPSDNHSPTLRFPQELIDHIVDHLHNDRDTLKACSQVAQNWVSSSRFHLFYKIALNITPHARTTCPPDVCCQRLYALLCANTKLSRYIQELEIWEGTQPMAHLLALRPELKSTAWVTTEDTLPLLLTKLTSLKNVSFRSTTLLHWKALPLPLQYALQHIFALPTLRYVHLDSWGFQNFVDFAKLLSLSPGLRGLSLLSCRVGGDEEEVDLVDLHESSFDVKKSESVTSHLEFLNLDFVNFRYLGYWLLSNQCTIDVTYLRELRVAHSHSVTAVERLLVAVGSSLEHFHLKPGPWDVHHFDLARNTGLRSLRLTLEDPAQAIPWVMALLNSVSEYNQLERIGIEFYVDLKKMDGCWKDVAMVLSRPQLSHLRRISIGVFASPLNADFTRVQQELDVAANRQLIRVYQLGIKSQNSCEDFTPRISRHQG